MSRHIFDKEDLDLLRQVRLAVKEKIKPDRKRLRRILLLKAAVYVSLPCLFYTGLYRIKDAFFFACSYMAYGLSMMLLALNFAHDLSHETVFRKRSWNNFFFHVIFFLVGGDGKAWKDRHVRSHHLAPNVDGHDTDLEISSLVRLSPESKVKKYHRFQFLYAPLLYGCYSLFWIFIKDTQVFLKNKKRAGEVLRFVVSKCFYLVYLFVLPLLFSEVNVAPVIIGFLSMHVLQSLFLLFTFLITHHVEACQHPAVAEEMIQASWFRNQVISSNDFYPLSRFANFIFGGFNDHVAHHLFPEMNHVYYPQVNRVIYPLLENNGLRPNSAGYFRSIGSHIRLLKRMG